MLEAEIPEANSPRMPANREEEVDYESKESVSITSIEGGNGENGAPSSQDY
jgi:hypothetical protein